MKAWLAKEQEHLASLMKSDSLPHAMILSGVTGSGKHDLSFWLAKSLLCQQSIIEDGFGTEELFSPQVTVVPCESCKGCNLVQQLTHPDLQTIELATASIGVDLIRRVSAFLEKTAQLSTNQVVIIQDADKMTESAANALLKTLEEPTSNSYLILLVNDEQRLLPTIISRCRHIQLRPPSGDKLLEHFGGGSDDVYVNLSHLPEISDPDLLEQYGQVHQVFLRFLLQNTQRMALTKLLITNENNVRWLEKIVVNLCRTQNNWRQSALPEGIDSCKLSTFLASKKDAIWRIYQLINQYNKQIVTVKQLNQGYGLEKLLVEIQLTLAA